MRDHISAIHNAAFLVRHYASQRGSSGRLRRAQAVLQLGLAVREAFNQSDDFETILAALLDDLRPLDRRPF